MKYLIFVISVFGLLLSKVSGHEEHRVIRAISEFSPESPATKEIKNYIKESQIELIDRIKYATGAKEIVGNNIDAISFITRTTTIEEKLTPDDEYDLNYFYTGKHYFIKVGVKCRGGGKINNNNQEQYLYFHFRMFKSDGKNNNKIEVVGMDENPYVKNLQDPIKLFGIFDIFIENVKDPLNLPRLKDSGIILDPKDGSKSIQRPKFNYN